MKHFTVTLIGECSVGKTTIANSLLEVPFTTEYKPTVGASILKLRLPDSDPVTVYLWDTAGMERYRSLAPVYYRDSEAAILVFDLSKEETFAKCEEWIALYRSIVGDAKPILVIGNKKDLEDSRQVDNEEATEWATKGNYRYLEVSGKTGDGIDLIRDQIAQMYGSRVHSTKVNASKAANPPKESDAKSGCC